MSGSRMILLVISIGACFIARTTCIIQYRKIFLNNQDNFDCYLVSLANIDENTNCPLNVNHECKIACAEDQNHLGCYCTLADGSEIVTANIFTPCPAGKIRSRIDVK